jgi:hypothetical protein
MNYSSPEWRSRKMGLTIICTILLLLHGGATGAGQKQHKANPGKPKLFEVGAAETDVYSLMGAPPRYFCVKAQKYVQQAQPGAGDVCRPVYSRKTERNEYEIMLFLEADASQSRLHPVQRVKEIRFTFDRDMTTEEAISDIAEASRLCQEQCAFTVFAGSDIIATPKSGQPRLVFHPSAGISGVTAQTKMAYASVANLEPTNLERPLE